MSTNMVLGVNVRHTTQCCIMTNVHIYCYIELNLPTFYVYCYIEPNLPTFYVYKYGLGC
jgi:hypothetical protein